jgi:signal recognition particle subunit SRP54
MHRGMSDMMKAMGGAKRGPLAGLAQALGMSGPMPSAQEIARLAEQIPGGLPGMPGSPPPDSLGLPKLPPTMPGLPPSFGGGRSGGLPGLGGPKPGGLPGLGGFPGPEKKK